MAWRRDWRWLAPVSFVLTQFYFWGWYDTFYQSTKLEPTLAFATLFLVIFSTLPVLNSIRSGSLDSLSGFLIALNAFNYLAAAYAMLWPQHRWPLTLLVLALSAAHLTVSGLIPAKKQGEIPLSRLLFGGLALTFATLAIPIRLDGKWITLAFAVEGAILIWTGFRALPSSIAPSRLFSARSRRRASPALPHRRPAIPVQCAFRHLSRSNCLHGRCAAGGARTSRYARASRKPAPWQSWPSSPMPTPFSLSPWSSGIILAAAWC